MLLYYITDRKSFAGTEAEQNIALLRRVATASRAGVDYIQLREKDLGLADLELLARECLHAIRSESPTAQLLGLRLVLVLVLEQALARAVTIVLHGVDDAGDPR